jgi:hypothetical protein
MESVKPPFRTGDTVHHGPTGEEWIVAYADPATGYMSWFGWPNGEAKICHCTLVEVASDEDHRKYLAELKNAGGSRSVRALRLYGDPSPTSPVAKDERHG